MIIKRLELQGFKSFPDRTKIIFHPGITAIVGPNGTGKSNIIDAILWVLGGQRQKALRGERTEDIIFNGNSRRAALSMAEVVMTLEEGNEEINISHRLFRSGESEYRLNGKPVRLRDIQDMLWKREVAEKDYFIIEQGSIGLLLTSKPQEKRQLLEEAAGTAFYKEKKKQAQSKLESSEQNLTRLEDIIAEVSRSKNSLARQAAAAQRYRRLRERIRELRSLLYLRKLARLEKQREEINQAYERCLEEEKSWLARIKKAEKEITSLRSNLWELGKWLETAREELYNLEAKRQQLETEGEARRIEYLEERKSQAREELNQLEEEKQVLSQELHLVRIVATDLEKRLESRLKAYNQAGLELEDLERKRKDLTEALQRERDLHLQLLSSLTEAKNRAARLEKETELSFKQENRLNQQIKETKAILEAIKTRTDEIQKKIETKEKERQDQQERIAGFERGLEELDRRYQELKGETEEKQKEKDQLSYQIQALQRICQQAIETKPTSEVPGSLGHLLSLIQATPGFGKVVDHYFGENVRAAVIPAEKLLKTENPGIKGVFFLLRPAADKACPSLPPHPGIIGCLATKLQPQEPLLAYWPQFKQVILVTNLKTAVELWLEHPSFDYLTLEGEVLFSSGLLRSKEKGEGLFALLEERQQLQEKLNQKEQELVPWLEKIRTLEVEKQNLLAAKEAQEQEIAQLIKRSSELEKERTHLGMEERQNRKNLELFAKELAFVVEERNQLQTNLRAGHQEVSQLAQKEVTAREKVAALEKLVAAEEEKIDRQRQLVMEFKALLEVDEEKKRHVSSQVKSIVQRQEALGQKIGNLLHQITAWEKEEEELRERLKQTAEELKSLYLSIEKKRQEITAAESKYALLRQEDEAKEKWLEEQREAYEQKKEERVGQEIARTQVERDLANLEENCWQELKRTLAELRSERQQTEMFNGEVEAELNQAEEELQKFKAVNLMAEEEYQQQKERYNFLCGQRDDLRESIKATREAIERIDEESKHQFLLALEKVNRHFQEVFELFFRGGTAEVRLLDPANPLESGAEIMAQPPGKRVQNITLLSGGEKSLTSLAFLFALFKTKPTPFCILDEVDAALDENNVTRFIDLMRKMKESTQFIIVTHNYKTMEVADYIYGTTMDEPNVTRLYSVRLEKKQETPSLS